MQYGKAEANGGRSDRHCFTEASDLNTRGTVPGDRKGR